jgi:hypothetical protein
VAFILEVQGQKQMKTIQEWKEILKSLRYKYTLAQRRYWYWAEKESATYDEKTCDACGRTEYFRGRDPKAQKRMDEERAIMGELSEAQWRIREWIQTLEQYAEGEPEYE